MSNTPSVTIKITQKQATPRPVATASGTGSSATRTQFLISLPQAHRTSARSPQGEIDEQRWALIEHALKTPELKSASSRLIAISSIVQSRKPLSDADVRRTMELAREMGWEPAPPVLPGDAQEQE